MTILLTIVVLLSGNPVPGAHIHIETMVWDSNNGEAVTDSRGHFVVEVTPGFRSVDIRPKVGSGFSSVVELQPKRKRLYVDLDGPDVSVE